METPAEIEDERSEDRPTISAPSIRQGTLLQQGESMEEREQEGAMADGSEKEKIISRLYPKSKVQLKTALPIKDSSPTNNGNLPWSEDDLNLRSQRRRQRKRKTFRLEIKRTTDQQTRVIN